MVREKHTCIRIGYGVVAPLHERKLQELCIETIGVLDHRLERQIAARKTGLTVCKNIPDAYSLKPDLWDICVSTHQHLAVLEEIIQINPTARIIVEKPICQAEQIPHLETILQNFYGKLVVNENYRASAITNRVKDLIVLRGITIQSIAIEMSKNRVQDMKVGGYIDSNVFFYEGPHMLTILENMVGKWDAFEDLVTKYSNFEQLPHQGTADISFKVNNTPVNLFTSMIGEVKYSYPPHEAMTMDIADTVIRNRALVVHGKEETIVGFYEPLEGFKRSQGAVGVYLGEQLISYEAPLYDDTMGLSLQRCTEYLLGDAKNPSPVEEAVEIVKMMNTLAPSNTIKCVS